MSNQFLNSESIFEVIGNYPIADQFDVLYTNLQTGSYTDNYITGSMLQIVKSFGGKTVFTQSSATRRVVFNKLGVDKNSLPEQSIDTIYRSYNLQPWRERAGFVNNLKIFSESERFYDSLLPDLSEMFKVLGENIVAVNNPAIGLIGNYINLDPYFHYYFPFESTFATVKRLSTFAKGFKGITQGASPQQIITNRLVLSFGGDWLNALNGKITYSSIYQVSHISNFPKDNIIPANSGSLPSDVAKSIFGFGDWNARPDNIRVNINAGYTHYPYFKSGSQYSREIIGYDDYSEPIYGDYLPRVVGPIIRGWKYGVHDGSPHYTSCIFRKNRFGQFRDMLEQRLSPVSYIDYENSPTQFFGDFEVPVFENQKVAIEEQPTIEYPVIVNFCEQKEFDTIEGKRLLTVPKEPTQTWSSNMSNYATSSLPFFDLENDSLGKNRGAIPESVLSPEITYTA